MSKASEAILNDRAVFLWSTAVVMLAFSELMKASCDIASSQFAMATRIGQGSHMEALDHATITRQDLREAAEEKGIPPSRLIPADGETVVLGRP